MGGFDLIVYYDFDSESVFYSASFPWLKSTAQAMLLHLSNVYKIEIWRHDRRNKGEKDLLFYSAKR